MQPTRRTPEKPDETDDSLTYFEKELAKTIDESIEEYVGLVDEDDDC